MTTTPVQAPSLDTVQRDALVVLILEGISMSRTMWQDKAKEAGIVDERGRSVYGESWKAVVSTLVESGCAVVERETLYRIGAGWTVPVLEDAHRRGRLGPIAERLSFERRHVYSYSGDLGRWRAQLLVALASGNGEAQAAAVQGFRAYRAAAGRYAIGLVHVLGLGLPPSWIARLCPELRAEYLSEALRVTVVGALPLGGGTAEAALASEDPEVRAHLAILRALMGDPAAARAALAPDASAWTRGAEGFIALTEGRPDDARQLFAEAGVGKKKQRVDLHGCLAVFDVLLAVTSTKADEVADVPRRLHKGKRHLEPFPFAEYAIIRFSEYRKNAQKESLRSDVGTWVDCLVVALVQRWMGGKVDGVVAATAERARASGLVWLADELQRIGSGTTKGSLLALFGGAAAWEIVLESLRSAAEGADGASSPKANKNVEVHWTLTAGPDLKCVSLEPYLVGPRGGIGRRVGAARLLSAIDGTVSDHDRRIAHAACKLGGVGTSRDSLRVLSLLVDHRRVRDELGRPLHVERGEPRLRLEKLAAGAKLHLVPPAFGDDGIVAERVSPSVVRVYTCTPAIARIVAVLPSGGLHVPAAGLARLGEALAAIGAAVAVEADTTVETVAAAGDSRIVVQLFRANAGLRLRLRVAPAGVAGPALRPGVPPADTVLPGPSGLVRVTRDLAAERGRLERLLERCPTVASLPQEGDDLVPSELVTCLEILGELAEAGEDCVLAWKEGQPLRVAATRSSSHFKVNVESDGSWLELSGALAIDHDKVLAMQELLAGASLAVGRFIPVGKDEYVALTEDLRKRVEMIGRAAALGRGGRVPVALLPAVEEICAGASVSLSEEVRARRDAFERARDLAVRVPRDLGAELRDYQREGFLFLARRTEAGLGACLADDMGLGKTVQALALLLHRKKRGPALVVAPMSVCRNWEEEARRFAPSLAILRLREGDRAALVADAGRSDVVILSYGLLVAEAQLIASRRWATVIFDEAHALKNPSTRRWSAARALDADAKVALTGTPVENHAADLHALFDVLNHGMLGSRSAFDRVLGTPLGAGDRHAAALLMKLVRPFVLRRTKAQVLEELPPKTELVRVVTPTPEHRAFYEAVRQRAVTSIEAARRAPAKKVGPTRIDLLAEITRLRRAAIDPRLVAGPEAPAGSKIEALVELALELAEEGRRALVFSQFLEVLDLARTALEARGVTCRRLDGTMDERARAEEVAAFQSGAADIFLVSLKAGGVGMNLTAADFVILLDPWWNPAVEDQAADRAHRIGQTRPVTVARIVTERTIEEKVLALHAKKRKLYDDVIGDADGAGALDLDALGALLDEDFVTAPPSRADATAPLH